MNRRARLGLLTGLLLTAGMLLLVGGSSPRPGQHGPSTVGLLATPGVPPAASATVRTRTRTWVPHVAQTIGRSSGPGRVARYFLIGWLRCSYHQAPCRQIAGTLHSYRRALDSQRRASLQTPVEVAARPEVLSVRLIYGCPASGTAVATYQDGEGGRFELHVSLIDTHGGWRVFDIAEAAPHIALPKMLNHGPGKC